MLNEKEMVNSFEKAIENNELVAYFQPQYNHSTGLMTGAEALARWIHPQHGVISPGLFIPAFEKAGLITRLDLHIFERACVFLRKMLDEKVSKVPISVNITRYDIFSEGFVEKLEEIRGKYDIPSKYLRLEITESAAIGGIDEVNKVIEKIHSYGYLVEMDDFGSGYSSLNMLKDIKVDIVKLDMGFIQGNSGNEGRGGIILSSVVRMLNWLKLPIIAEGVETIKDADYLKTIGCNVIQGFLYSKPLNEEDFYERLCNEETSVLTAEAKFSNHLSPEKFWDPNSLETLIFSSYVGGAAIFTFSDGNVEILRVNQKYMREIGMNMSEEDYINSNFWDGYDEEEKRKYLNMIYRAIDEGSEQECETKRVVVSECCGEDNIYIRTNIQLIGRSGKEYIFYAMIRNVTSEKKRFVALEDYEHKFKQVTEQVNIYYWEYEIATKIMKPCYRCMRDLGLPPVVYNYPEPAIEQGIFPADYADMYRGWHKKLEEGVEVLEDIIPLTVGRVPFRVKYVNEFDENGRPIKAYGSATFINGNEE